MYCYDEHLMLCFELTHSNLLEKQMNFKPAKTIAGIARELGVSRTTIYNKLTELKLTRKIVFGNVFAMLTLYKSLSDAYNNVDAEDIEPAKNQFIASLPDRPENHLNRATLSRFAKQAEISIKDIDRVLLAMLVGSFKNPVSAYKDLLKFKQLKQACMASGLTWDQLHEFAKRKD